MQSKSYKFFAMLCGALTLMVASRATAASEKAEPFLPSPVVTVSTVPPNGDVNPYGVAFVPLGFPTGGALAPGDVLVSNFNNNQNLQGTGTTICQNQKWRSVSFLSGPGPAGTLDCAEGAEGRIRAGWQFSLRGWNVQHGTGRIDPRHQQQWCSAWQHR